MNIFPAKFPLVTGTVLLCITSSLGAERPTPKPERWEPQIAAFEKQDEAQPPPKQGILFVGSSSIVGWNLKQSFPDLPVIKRGFGGSQLIDSLHFAPRIVLPHEPKVVVVYAGDNDLAAGVSPAEVLADYQGFVKSVHAKLPQTRIVYIAVKPSVARWKLIDKQRETNRLIREAASGDERLVFLDVVAPMLNADGEPRKELFKGDGLHLNEDGYQLWNTLVKPHLAVE